MHRRLAEKRVEVVGGRAAIAGGKHDDFAALLPLQGKSDAAREGSQPAYFAEGGQDAVLLAAVVRGHVAARRHRPAGARVCFAQRPGDVAGALQPCRQVAIVEGHPVVRVECGGHGCHALMPGAPDIEREFPLRLAYFQKIVHDPRRDHRAVQGENIQRLCCGGGFRSSYIDCHA